MTAPYAPPTIAPSDLTTAFPLAHLAPTAHLAATGSDIHWAWIALAVGVILAGLISLCVAGLREQLHQDRMGRLEAEAAEKHERQLARRRYHYQLRRLPRFKISTEIVRRDEVL